MLARIAAAFINLSLAQPPLVAWITHACEGIGAIDALPMVAWRGQAVVDICLTVGASEA